MAAKSNDRYSASNRPSAVKSGISENGVKYIMTFDINNYIITVECISRLSNITFTTDNDFTTRNFDIFYRILMRRNDCTVRMMPRGSPPTELYVEIGDKPETWYVPINLNRGCVSSQMHSLSLG